LGKPIVVNISFGNNYGSHKGDSLLETYLDSVSAMGRNVVCTGMGNNGNDALHTGGKLSPGETQEIELGVGAFEPTLNVQLWKNYEDEMEIYLENPAGERVGPLSEILGAQRWQVGNTELLIYYGKPAPYHVTQEIYVDFLAQDGKRPYVDSGVWKIILAARNIKSGEYFLWLPGGKTLNPGTAFYLPRPQGTLTIPATARRLISVGAYDSRLLAYAGFSGRGSSELPYEKPDLTAPGVGITAPRAGGGYGSYTGTSFAVPFVSGSAALLMEWGIIKGNDPYLYGEKVKAYLRRGTKPLPEYEQYPNYEVGWGRLCLSESIPK
ncbi:S8 family serine peptidase, partial [Blautia glucerasea]